MGKTNISHITELVVVSLLFLWLLPSPGGAQTMVDCDAGGVLQDAIDAAATRDTIEVSGTCNENVSIRENKRRITLDGKGTATIDGGGGGTTVEVRGRGHEITGFTITGGNRGISVSRGGTALIDGNTIQNANSHGIRVTQRASARIVNNIIRNNGANGIFVSENSSARIGFTSSSDTAASPNTIENNTEDGIRVRRYSNARIVGNTIRNNTDDGIDVEKVSHADIASNTIEGNGVAGITLSGNSGVNLGEPTITDFFDSANSTSAGANNVTFGISCSLGSSVRGRLGTLNGDTSATNFSGDCIRSLIPTIASVSPEDGPTAGGTTVTITGSEFIDGSTTVTFDGLDATNITVASATSLTADTPAHAEGTVDIVVTTTEGAVTQAGGFTYIDDPTPSPEVLLVASILPASRSVQVGTTATAFLTILNGGTSAARRVTIALADPLAANFTFQTTDPATNAITGTAGTPVDIAAAGGSQTYVIALTPTAAIAPTDVEFTFTGLNANPVTTITGVNTMQFSASATPIPDIVALAATIDNDGIVKLASTGVFAVATVNVGATGTITASVDTGSVTLPVTITICETEPSTGVCTNPTIPTTVPVTTTINANATPTFGIFVDGTADVPFDPATNRIFVRFKDSGGVTRGSTSVAVRSEP